METQQTDLTARLVEAIVRSRWAALVLAGAITVVAGVFARTVSIDTSLEAWFLEDDSTVLTYREFRRRFGEDEFIVVGVDAPDVFTPAVLKKIDRLTGLVGSIRHVRRVTSLTNVEVLAASRFSVMTVPLMGQLPETKAGAAELRKAALSHPLVTGNLVAADGRSAAIVVELGRECDTFGKKTAVVHALRSTLREHLSEVSIRMAGSPVVSDAVSRYIEKDLRTLIPVAFLLVAVSTFLLSRRLAVPLISLVVVGLAALWVLGVMGMLGIDMNLLGSILMMVILVVGVADSIHIFSTYFQELELADSSSAALRQALKHVLLPCTVTSVTTVGGFLSLLSSNLQPIRQFGMLAALGTAFALLISIFLIPALLQLVPGRNRGRRRRISPNTMDRILGLLGRPDYRVSLALLVVLALVTAPAIWSISLIQITANPMNYFRPHDPIRQDTEAIDTALGGAATLEFIVRAPGRGLLDWYRLKRLDQFERWLEKRPAVTRVTSAVDLLKEVQRVRHGRGRLPPARRVGIAMRIANKVAPETFNSYVQDDYCLGRITARVQSADADLLVAQAPEIEAKILSELDAPELRLEVTGFVKLMDDMRSYLIRSQVFSILLAFVTITLVMLVFLRSWKMALFSMIPNLGPILAGLVLMAVLKISLDPGTVMIATIAMGLVVDDSCHFLVRLREQSRLQSNLLDAIAETMNQTGRPIILTSLILASGFAALILGSFTPTICFGLVSAFVLLTALFGALVVLPAALLVFHPRL